MKLADVMLRLASQGSATTKRTFLRHGAQEPLFGVKVGDLKPLQKELKGEQKLALELYATGNSDAMYLAGLIANGAQMTEQQLDDWARKANWSMLAEYTVPWVASEHPQGLEIALRWIDSKEELIAAAGWATLGALLATRPDDQLPVATFTKLLRRVGKELKRSPNRVRYTMNGFVISAGTYSEPLAELALEVAAAVGTVEVDVGETACKVPDAATYIAKSRKGDRAAPKRKSVRC